MNQRRHATWRDYSPEPPDKRKFTESHDRLYSRFASAYDLAVRYLPVWKSWLRRALPYIEGPRVLEVSFGTGWLLTQYASRFETHGIDLNEAMLAIARRNLQRAGMSAQLRRGDVEVLPFPDGHFDTVVNTMSFTGYPNAAAAMSELRRVLRPGGRLVLIDVNYPADGNRLGTALVNVWKRSGDLVRDMHALFAAFEFDASDEEIGGWGSVHLYVARRDAPGHSESISANRDALRGPPRGGSRSGRRTFRERPSRPPQDSLTAGFSCDIAHAVSRLREHDVLAGAVAQGAALPGSKDPGLYSRTVAALSSTCSNASKQLTQPSRTSSKPYREPQSPHSPGGILPFDLRVVQPPKRLPVAFALCVEYYHERSRRFPATSPTQ